MQRPKTTLLILFSLILLTLQGCDWLDELLYNPQVNSVEEGNIIYKLKTIEYEYSIGEEVNFEYTIKNNGSKQVTFESTSMPIEQYIVEKNGQLIYYEMGTSDALDSLTLKAGKSHTYNLTWAQVETYGDSVGIGVYTIKACLNVQDRVYVPVNIEIVE